MDFFDSEDLETISNYAGLDYDPEKHNELRLIYDKLGHLCNLIQFHGYVIDIRKDPRKQAGPGRFVFQNYQWAKIYPKEYCDDCKGKFAYIIGIDGESLHFHLMGIKDYYETETSKNASKKCWNEIDFEGKDYNYLVDQFVKFENFHRTFFIETGAALGIQKFQIILDNMNSLKLQSLLKYKKQIILQGPPGTGKTKLAKEIAQQLTEEGGEFKTIQFHPAYTYEDFIRGISAISNGHSIEYKTVDKILIEFANKANTNYQKYLNSSLKMVWVKTQIEKYKKHVETQLLASSAYYLKGSNEKESKILYVKDDSFFLNNDTYKGDGFSISYLDICEIIISMPINSNYDIDPIPDRKWNYKKLLIPLLSDIQQFNGVVQEFEDIKLEYYVLIIDELNRANLASVFGELIFALEYRGTTVESLYEINGSRSFILPPNLLIIGTINTADRSVGHIDYAIRRRFAFVDVLPKDLTNDLGDKFHKALYEEVKELFKYDSYLSKEFNQKDVQLGHSYFIDKGEEGGSMAIRLEYEIKPILKEYIKDGILVGKNIEDVIENLTV